MPKRLLAVASALIVSSFTSPQRAWGQTDRQPTQQSFAAAKAKAIETIAYAQGIDAGIWGSPLVIMYMLRHNDALGPNAQAAPNALWRMENISTPKLSEQSGYVTPNVNTIYGFGFLDLGPEPVVLSVPDSKGRYYVVEIVDMWTNAFAYVGGVATGYKGGKFALVGPGWKGELPPGMRRIDCPTRWVLIQPRVHLLNQPDLPAAQRVIQAIDVQGFAKASGKPAPKAPVYHYAAPVVTDPKLPVSALAFKDPLQFWEILADALIENPPPEDQAKALLPLFGSLGLKAGKVWMRTEQDPDALRGMRRAIVDLPTTLNYYPSYGSKLINGWRSTSADTGDFKTNYLLRASIARGGLTANIVREAVYITAYIDQGGTPLTGNARYAVTFKELPPFMEPGFWSMTMYDFNNNYTVPNPIDRYSLGSDNKMKLNADGSLTIYLQKENPGPEKEANWLPAPPGQFYLTLRAYSPGPALIESLTNPKAWPRPTVAPLK